MIIPRFVTMQTPAAKSASSSPLTCGKIARKMGMANSSVLSQVTEKEAMFGATQVLFKCNERPATLAPISCESNKMSMTPVFNYPTKCYHSAFACFFFTTLDNKSGHQAR